MEYEARVDRDGEPVTFGKSRFGYAFDMNEEFEQMEGRKSMADVICRVCYEIPVDPKITDVSASAQHTDSAQLLTWLFSSADTRFAEIALLGNWK